MTGAKPFPQQIEGRWILSAVGSIGGPLILWVQMGVGIDHRLREMITMKTAIAGRRQLSSWNYGNYEQNPDHKIRYLDCSL